RRGGAFDRDLLRAARQRRGRGRAAGGRHPLRRPGAALGRIARTPRPGPSAAHPAGRQTRRPQRGTARRDLRQPRCAAARQSQRLDRCRRVGRGGGEPRGLPFRPGIARAPAPARGGDATPARRRAREGRGRRGPARRPHCRAHRQPVLDDPRRGRREAPGAGCQGGRQRAEEDPPGRGRRGRRLQARQGPGARQRGLGRGRAAGVPRRARGGSVSRFRPGPGWRDDIGADAGWAPSATRDAVRLRAWVNRLVREFFFARDVLEVETPLMSRAGNTDPNIASFALEFSGRTDGAPRKRWLRTSAEYPMKRLLAAGAGDCFELGRVFRDGEAGGRHNPEFSMLEWYRVGWDHLRLADETVELVQAALSLVGREASVAQTTFRELYRDTLGVDPLTAGVE